MWRSPSLVVVGVVFLASACTSSADVQVQVASVGPGEVVQTVAAAAQLEAADRVTVQAPVGGEVAELLVGDGDQVSAGDPLVRLESDSIDQQVRQAEMAAEAAGDFAGSAAGAGLDLSPVVGAFGTQLEAIFPPLIGTLNDQVTTLENAALAAEQARQDLQADIEEARRDLEEQAAEVTLPDLPDVTLPDRPDAETPADVDPPQPGIDLELPAIEVPQVIDPDELHRAAADARARLAEAEAGYRAARGQLAQAESDLAGQAQQASAVQLEAAEAQREQAELALESARARVDDLTIVAPVSGVVELARGADDPAAGLGSDAGGLGDAGELEALGGAGDLDALGGLLGGGGGSAGTSTGPLAEGVGVGAGQPLLTIFDLSGFTARVDVDEIDIVDLAVGQAVTVLVDAYADAELSGTVRYIALAPQQPPGGGAIFPVTVDLDPTPDDVRLRVGLTASAEVEVQRIDADTVVPTSALLRRGGGEVVYVARDGIAVEVPITVDAIGDDTAAVSGDVTAGDEVVTTGVELVEDGTPIQVGG